MLPQTLKAAVILSDTVRNEAFCESSNSKFHRDFVSNKSKPDLGVLDEIKDSVFQEKFVDLERDRRSNEGGASGPTSPGGEMPQTNVPGSTHIVSEDSEAPDGGFRAWLVVFGAMCSAFATGYSNAWGIFQEYYERNVLSESSPSNIAWIGSIQYALVFLPGLPMGRLFDLGYFRSMVIPASALLIIATFLIPECKEYWQFLLCQGLATGLACGAFFGPVTAILSMWFKKKRGLALGLFATGSSIGGTVIPIALRSLIPKVGFTWTVRIVGCILFATLSVANLTLKRRTPPASHSEGILNLRLFRQFRSPAFTIYCMSTFFVYLGFYTLLTYVSTTSTSIGVSESFSFYLVSIANASGGLGRIGAGLFADKFGALNILVPFTVLTGAMTCLWPFVRSTSGLIIVVAIYGLSSGSYGSLVSVPVIEIGELEDTHQDLGQRIGILMTFLASGSLLGPPISGLIFHGLGIEAMGIYAGCMILFGVSIMCIPRYLVLDTKGKVAGTSIGWVSSRV